MTEKQTKKSAFLSRDAILKAQDIESVILDIPEWGGTINVRGMSGHERDQFEQSLIQQRGKDQRVNMKNARAKIVVLCAVDEDGNRIFTDTDISALGRKSAKALDRIFTVAQDLSGIKEDDLDELTKNSEGMTSED